MRTYFCNICGAFAAETKTKRLVPDHNPNTGYIRGDLCDRCNNYVSIFEGDKEKPKKNKAFKIWLQIYGPRILTHLTTNTGILFKERSWKWVYPKTGRL